MPRFTWFFDEQALAQASQPKLHAVHGGEAAASSDRGDYTTGFAPLSDNINYSLLISARLSTLSGSTCGRGSRYCDSLLAGVYDESLAAQETYERQSEFTRELYGQT